MSLLSHLWTLFTSCYLFQGSRFSFWIIWKHLPEMTGIYELQLLAPPPGPIKEVHYREWGEESSVCKQNRMDKLPADRRYLCFCQHFRIKIRRVTEVWGGVWKERQPKTQPSISCLPSVGSGAQTSVTQLCEQLLHTDADGKFSASFLQVFCPRPLHGKMA